MTHVLLLLLLTPAADDRYLPSLKARPAVAAAAPADRSPFALDGGPAALRLVRTAAPAGSVVRGPAGAYTFVAGHPVTITIEAGGVTFGWADGGGEAVVPLPVPPPDDPPPPPDDPPPPAPAPVPAPAPPVPGPIVPFPPGRPAACMTLVYDVSRATPGVAAIRSSQEVRDQMAKMGIRWLVVDRSARMAPPRQAEYYYQAMGLDRALGEANVEPPAIVSQAADGSVLRVRKVPTDEAAARKLMADFLAMPAGAQTVAP